jgi:hypothetical protein
MTRKLKYSERRSRAVLARVEAFDKEMKFKTWCRDSLSKLSDRDAIIVLGKILENMAGRMDKYVKETRPKCEK